ncbi:hypothetical protein ACVWZK_006230 [Bradyrhizobium sp. GM0.4]
MSRWAAKNIGRARPLSPQRPAIGVAAAPATPISAKAAIPLASRSNGASGSRSATADQNAVKEAMTSEAVQARTRSTGSSRSSLGKDSSKSA